MEDDDLGLPNVSSAESRLYHVSLRDLRAALQRDAREYVAKYCPGRPAPAAAASEGGGEVEAKAEREGETTQAQAQEQEQTQKQEEQEKEAKSATAEAEAKAKAADAEADAASSSGASVLAHPRLRGLFLIPDFVSEEEERALIAYCERNPWDTYKLRQVGACARACACVCMHTDADGCIPCFLSGLGIRMRSD